MNDKPDMVSDDSAASADAAEHEERLDHDSEQVNGSQPEASDVAAIEPEPRRNLPLASSSSGTMAGVSPRFAIDGGARPPLPVFDDRIFEITRSAATEVSAVAAEFGSVLQDTTRVSGTAFSSFMSAMADSSLAVHETLVNALRSQWEESLDLLQQLVSARDPAEAFAIQAQYWERQMALLSEHAEEIRKAGERAFESAAKPYSDELLRATQRYRLC